VRRDASHRRGADLRRAAAFWSAEPRFVESAAADSPACDDAPISPSSKEGTTMRLFVKLAGLVAAGLSGAALVAAPLAAASPEDDFVATIANQGITWPGATPDNIVQAGKGVCQDWAAGATLEQEVSSLAPHLSSNDAAFFIGAATGAFCPDYQSKLS